MQRKAVKIKCPSYECWHSAGLLVPRLFFGASRAILCPPANVPEVYFTANHQEKLK